MPLVQVSLAAGRPPDQIRELITEVHEAVVRATGTDPARVRVLVQELPQTHWAAGGVTLAERDAPATGAPTTGAPATTDPSKTTPGTTEE